MPDATHCIMCNKQLPKRRPAKGRRPPNKKSRPPGKKRRPPARKPHPQDVDPNKSNVFGNTAVLDEMPLPGTGKPRKRRPRPKVNDGDVLIWLCCDPFRPVPVLKTTTQVTLGRGRENDMILPHESVSRVHTAIRLLGGKVVAEDRSTYGSYLNNKRFTSKEISLGDVLTLGPFSIEVAAKRKMGRDPTKEETRPLRLPTTTEAMQGRLEKVSLSEVLQQIEFYKKTGTLKIFLEDKDPALLVIYEGKPMYAEFAPKKDDEAVFAMLRLEEGNFSFMSKVEAGEMTMGDKTLSALLMDYSRQADEGKS